MAPFNLVCKEKKTEPKGIELTDNSLSMIY